MRSRRLVYCQRHVVESYHSANEDTGTASMALGAKYWNALCSYCAGVHDQVHCALEGRDRSSCDVSDGWVGSATANIPTIVFPQVTRSPSWPYPIVRNCFASSMAWM